MPVSECMPRNEGWAQIHTHTQGPTENQGETPPAGEPRARPSQGGIQMRRAEGAPGSRAAEGVGDDGGNPFLRRP